MNIKKSSIRIIVSLVLSLSSAALINAQATRTWVSGVGDDANPCSRTAPCKTYQGAISKTATNGEINSIDPAGFGAVTITKSITIDGGPFMAGVLSSGTNGIIINAAGAQVTLRNLTLDGFTTGLNGIRILNAAAVFVENCQIFGYNRGISDERTFGELSVSNSIIKNNAQTNAYIANGSTVTALFDTVQVKSGGNFGLWFQGGVSIVRNCVVSANVDTGILAENSAEVEVDGGTISQNQFGVGTGAGSPTVRVGQANITMNKIGLSIGGGAIHSYGNNRTQGNTSGSDTPTSILTQQ
jgi:hypothetical protein